MSIPLLLETNHTLTMISTIRRIIFLPSLLKLLIAAQQKLGSVALVQKRGKVSSSKLYGEIF